MAGTRTVVSLYTADGDQPIVSGDHRGNLLRLSALLRRLASGEKPVPSTVKVQYSCAASSGTVTAAAVQSGDTFTIAGVTFTAQQAYATGTVTLTSIAADETVTVNGVVFTAKASPSGESQFDQSGNDTADATSLAAKINAHSQLANVVTATSASNVVTIRAYSPGTAGNAITLASSSEAVSGATLANGAAVANNKFCFTGSNTECAADIVRAVRASTSAAVKSLIGVSNSNGVVTFTSLIPGKVGDFITLASSNNTRLEVSGATLSGGSDTSLALIEL